MFKLKNIAVALMLCSLFQLVGLSFIKDLHDNHSIATHLHEESTNHTKSNHHHHNHHRCDQSASPWFMEASVGSIYLPAHQIIHASFSQDIVHSQEHLNSLYRPPRIFS